MVEHISIVIATYNEEARIARFLSGVSWADEVIVVDGMSSDRTATIASEMGARVILRPNQPIAMINKNIGIEQATGDWILVLDADEHVPPTLIEALRAHAAHPGDVVALRIARQNYLFGQWMRHGLRWPDYQTRFFRRGVARFAESVHGQTVVQGRAKALPARPDLALIHDPVNSLTDWVRKLNWYANQEAQTWYQQGVRPSLLKMLLYPPALFLYDYIWLGAALDGRWGFVLSILMGYYTFLKRAMLWERTIAKGTAVS